MVRLKVRGSFATLIDNCASDRRSIQSRALQPDSLGSDGLGFLVSPPISALFAVHTEPHRHSLWQLIGRNRSGTSRTDLPPISWGSVADCDFDCVRHICLFDRCDDVDRARARFVVS
jgi:hypothetical protein